ncbi:MAG: sortase [Anaerolineae bacterium]|nr:sortase [Anaerolineae bacterium]
MRRNILALGIVSGPVLIVFSCLVGLMLTCAAGWWLSGPDDESRLVRIMSLAPLATPQAYFTQPAEDAVGQDGQIAFQSSAAPGEEYQPPVYDEAELAAHQEVENALGFSLPVGSVNSITQEGVATRLVIPRLNLDAPVVLSPIENQTWKVEHLGTDKVGHLEGTAPPGSNSNIVLAAHVTVSAGVYGPFAQLASLQPGDQVYIYYGQDVYEYIIDDYDTVDRTAIEVTHPTNTGRVTLITCSNWSAAEGRYVERLVVTGHLN